MGWMVGDRVVLDVPENPRLHGMGATIRELTDYGAIVFCDAAATKQYRATFDEMGCPREATEVRANVMAMVEQGYTGDICSICAGCRMKRTGPCLTCDDCGHNDGCS